MVLWVVKTNIERAVDGKSDLNTLCKLMLDENVRGLIGTVCVFHFDRK